MKKIFTITFLCVSIFVSAQNRLTKEPNEKPVNLSGLISLPGHAPKGEMANSLPLDKLKENCHFFEGDTLDGFDFEKFSKQTFTDGIKLLSEYKNEMRIYQIEFVKNKFNLSKIAKFEKTNNYKGPVFPAVASSGCGNIDFEDGNLNGWTVSSGDNQNSNSPLTVLGAGLVSTNQDIYSCNSVNLITSAYGTDAIGLTGLDPNGGSTSVRLGGFSINVSETAGLTGFGCVGSHWSYTYSNGEIISKTVAVTAANALMAYDYQVVLNDGGHPNGQQPYFHVFITNPSGTVLSTCTEYYVQGVAGNPPVGFINSGYVNTNDNSVVYMKTWTSNSINLTPYIGQNVIVSFVAAGCTPGAHFSYAYVDAICGPVAITASDTTPCLGTNVTLTAPSVQGGTYSWSGPGISGSTTTHAITVTTSGTYTVTITPSQGAGCAYTITKTLNFKPLPTATITTTPVTICAGGVLALNATATGGSGVYPSTVWTGTGAGSLSSTSILNPNFTNSAMGSYPLKITVTDGNGCIGKDSTIVIVKPSTSPTITASGPTVLCSGGSVTLDAGAGYTTYAWSNSATTQTITVTNSGSYSVTVGDANGCGGTSATATTVTVKPNPTPTITASGPTTMCSGGSVTLNAGAGYSSYSWSNGASSQTINVTTTGYFSVTITDTSGCTGSSTTSTTVTVNPPDNASFVYPSATYCQSGTSPTPAITGLPGGTFSATPSPGLAINASTGTINLSLSALGSYTLSYTTNGICPTTSSITMTIANITPLAAFSYPNLSYCQNASNPLPIFSPGATAGIFSATPAGLTFVHVNTGQINLSSSAPGTYIVTNNIPPSATCGAVIATTTVIITQADDASFYYPSATYCQSGVNPTPTITGLQGGTFSSTPSGLLINPTTGNINLAGSALGAYTLSYSTFGPCPNTSSITMTIANTTPFANFSYPGTPFCQNTTNPLPTFGPGASAGFFSATPAGLVFAQVNTGAINLSTSAAGTYTVTNSIPASGICAATSATYTVVINPTPIITATPSTQNVCKGSVSSIALSSTVPGTNFSWTVVQTGVSGASAGGGPNISQTLTLTGTIQGTVMYIINANAGNCTGPSITVTITVNPLPVANITAVAFTTANCGNNTGSITGITMTSGLAPYTYVWHDASNNVVGNGSIDLTNVGAGAYSLTITDANGCSAATTVGPFTVTAPAPVVAAFTANPMTGETPLTVNFTNGSTGATNYLWLFGTGDTSSAVSPTYIYKPVGDFKACLVAGNSYGCYDTVCSVVDISVYSVFMIPNIFTPNGDGINDIFTVVEKGLKSIDAEIYNRWGQKLYEWHTVNGGWNGNSASGVAASDGSYYYIIKADMVDGKSYLEKGFFSLQR